MNSVQDRRQTQLYSYGTAAFCWQKATSCGPKEPSSGFIKKMIEIIQMSN